MENKQTGNSYQYIYAGETLAPETLKKYNIEPIYGNQILRTFLSRVLEAQAEGINF